MVDKEAIASAQQTLLDGVIARVHPMAKSTPIEVAGYGETARYPIMEMRCFITVGRPRMWSFGTAVL